MYTDWQTDKLVIREADWQTMTDGLVGSKNSQPCGISQFLFKFALLSYNAVYGRGLPTQRHCRKPRDTPTNTWLPFARQPPKAPVTHVLCSGMLAFLHISSRKLHKHAAGLWRLGNLKTSPDSLTTSLSCNASVFYKRGSRNPTIGTQSFSWNRKNTYLLYKEHSLFIYYLEAMCYLPKW